MLLIYLVCCSIFANDFEDDFGSGYGDSSYNDSADSKNSAATYSRSDPEEELSWDQSNNSAYEAEEYANSANSGGFFSGFAASFSGVGDSLGQLWEGLLDSFGRANPLYLAIAGLVPFVVSSATIYFRYDVDVGSNSFSKDIELLQQMNKSYEEKQILKHIVEKTVELKKINGEIEVILHEKLGFSFYFNDENKSYDSWLDGTPSVEFIMKEDREADMAGSSSIWEIVFATEYVYKCIDNLPTAKTLNDRRKLHGKMYDAAKKFAGFFAKEDDKEDDKEDVFVFRQKETQIELELQAKGENPDMFRAIAVKLKTAIDEAEKSKKVVTASKELIKGFQKIINEQKSNIKADETLGTEYDFMISPEGYRFYLYVTKSTDSSKNVVDEYVYYDANFKKTQRNKKVG